MKKYSFKEKVKFFLDRTLSGGTGSIILWLSVITFFMVLFFAFIYLLIGVNFENSGRLDFYEAFWQSLMRALDSGTVAGDTQWPLRIVGFFVTVGGIFILSTLIGILTTGLDQKLQELRKGRSAVIGNNYTLIIGWSPKIIHIIEQLILANENKKKASIVILAEKDKLEMEDEIKHKIPDTKTTQIICRTGNALEHRDLEIVNPDNAKSIIILTPENLLPALHDIHVIKTILSLTYNKERKLRPYHIVAEIKNKENLQAAEIAGGDEVSLIFPKDIVAKITAQTSRQSGLSSIYLELVSYEGDEIYLQKQPELQGKTYKQILFAYETSSVIGIKKSNGEILINPPMNTLFEKDDKVIAISQNDDTVILSKKQVFNINENIIKNTKAKSSISQGKILLLGWNSTAYNLILELEKYVNKNSELTIVVNEEINKYNIANLKRQLQNIHLIEKIANYSNRTVLLNLNIEKFDTIIILANENTSPQLADAITLITLIHLRDIVQQINKKINIVSEMYIQKNRELAEITQADDFIISNDFISRILTQVSEDKDILKILNLLFDSEGSEIYIKEATDYIQTGIQTNFYTILEAAARKGHTAIGYRLIKYAHDHSKNYGICINPNKANKITLSEGDKIIVLAEN